MEIVPYDILLEQEKELTRQLEIVINYKKTFYPERSSEVEVQNRTPPLHAEPPKKRKRRHSRMPSKLSTTAVTECIAMINKGSRKDIAGKLFELYPNYFDYEWDALGLVVSVLQRLLNTNKIEIIEKLAPIHGGSIYKLKTS
ncbi:hypothetical protein AAFN85_13700 [Mucilaginibacter sp. CAU 1740]|uniref:hypothetical protein n=1 Tax=Mucilaginibacter sp. CAU 1740 TaxID=3140365 RepID=UPI00325AC893